MQNYHTRHEMPADVDCFEVLPESHKGYAFTLRIESLTNAPVKVVCRAYQQTLTMQGMVIQTNIPATLGTVEIEVSSPCQRGHVPYKVQAFRKNPVIIVHGLMDGPRTWDDHDHLWHDLCAMLRYSGHPCEYLYCSTYWTTLELATRKLHDLIDSLYELDTSSVVVIAHSTGALIADLCLARYTASPFRNRVKTLVAIGGVHRGSLFANIWRDLTASSVVGYINECSAEIKNALEVGRRYSQMLCMGRASWVASYHYAASTNTPSTQRSPRMTRGSSALPFSRRQCFSASVASLNTIVIVAWREPQPLVCRVRSCADGVRR